MGAVFGVAWSLMLTAGGAAVAASAPHSGAAPGGQYLAGHVLLGVGIGQLAAVLLRAALQHILGRLRARAASPRAPQAVTGAHAAAADTAAAPLPARVSTLPVRPAASLAPLRGRHAA
ncbi:conserved hypothetical protein [Pseudarthrobacter chlorophenolicus A6]|uniref:Uncharacterized protein n=1 Tax=Pseudarthrobacter chlorophenolicus (strain ATCC 700700 / DSM 12829 / CIP 107037 / JCM 12360 / KCTC 9906 / NCIMB 13794 / A6) TaxID=452863 RepID=B8H7I1_PSECP|nr:hypothetical protein [Pseudarthrobacter chlorophenolicus]ACL39761.1 conserved hypothetical protein [Pseudarthrobacter chlorophenolicus A6]SDQ94177.1 hypothetical protein SAMN04489738_3725 [Pseudarthrobacter chlorophenolicus]